MVLYYTLDPRPNRHGEVRSHPLIKKRIAIKRLLRSSQ